MRFVRMLSARKRARRGRLSVCLTWDSGRPIRWHQYCVRVCACAHTGDSDFVLVASRRCVFMLENVTHIMSWVYFVFCANMTRTNREIRCGVCDSQINGKRENANRIFMIYVCKWVSQLVYVQTNMLTDIFKLDLRQGNNQFLFDFWFNFNRINIVIKQRKFQWTDLLYK